LVSWGKKGNEGLEVKRNVRCTVRTVWKTSKTE
jgi:hypothetical protein